MCTPKDDGSSSMIIVHGSGQDGGCGDQVTTRVAEAGRKEGREVFDLGGPGSTERSLIGSAGSSSIYDIDLPLDYAYKLGAGGLFGEGFKEIVEEGLEELMRRSKKNQTIDLVGFSRGAVAIVVMLDMAAKYWDKERCHVPKIRVTALDPVPGPIGIPKCLTLPSQVTNFNLFYSKHEGRPGFQQLDLILSGSTALYSDMIIGRHGDIGGGKQSPLVKIVEDDVLKKVGLPGLGQRTVSSAALDSLLNSEDYTDQNKYRTREFQNEAGESWHPTLRADIEMPSSEASEILRFSILGRLLTGSYYGDFDPSMEEAVLSELSFNQHLIPKIEKILNWRQTKGGTIMFNPRPFKGNNNKIVVPYPQIKPLNIIKKNFGTKLLKFLKK